MLFAGSAYSELPISTSKQQELNGEEFYYDFLIDQLFPLDLNIQEEEDFALSISRSLDYELDIKK